MMKTARRAATNARRRTSAIGASAALASGFRVGATVKAPAVENWSQMKLIAAAATSPAPPTTCALAATAFPSNSASVNPLPLAATTAAGRADSGGQASQCHRHQPTAARGVLAATFLPRRCTLPEFQSVVSYCNTHPRTRPVRRLRCAGSLAPAGHSVPVGRHRVRLERRRSGLRDGRRVLRQAHASQDAPRHLGLGH